VSWVIPLLVGLALGWFIDFCIRRDVDFYLNVALVVALVLICVVRVAA
jgi:small basic protein